MLIFQTYYLTVTTYTLLILNDFKSYIWDIAHGYCSQRPQKQAF